MRPGKKTSKNGGEDTSQIGEQKLAAESAVGVFTPTRTALHVMGRGGGVQSQKNLRGARR